MAYWLLKSEPDCFSFDDLMASEGQMTGWDGVRNFQARNYLRDALGIGDGVLYYHSNANPPCIVGLAEVVEAGHPDPTAFDEAADHYDPKSVMHAPTWFQVTIRGIRPAGRELGLPLLRTIPELADMELLRKGSRLSVQVVRPEEWAAILEIIDGPNP